MNRISKEDLLYYALQHLELLYKTQKSSAKTRDVAFELSFQEWLDIWVESGQLRKRGQGRGMYCMGRKGDKGPYAVGNVEIIRSEDNVSKASVGNSYALGSKRTEEYKKNISAILRGRPKSKITRERMKAAAAARSVEQRHAIAMKGVAARTK